MSRYIDADKFKMNLKTDKYGNTDVDEVGKALDKSTADVVEVVWCKDCKHYSHDVDANEGEWDCCRVYGMFVDPNDYCSEGERKESK